MRRIVCLGGGTGQSQLLKGLRAFQGRVTGVVGVTDEGGHTGLLRKALGIPAVGDLRNCLENLDGGRTLLGGVLAHRFREGALSGVSTGNLVLAALCRREGKLSVAVGLLALLALPVGVRADDLLAEVDRAARQRHESRNRFVTRVLQHAVRARRDAEITRRLNELFAAPEFAEQQRREASQLDAMGTPWADERW